VGKLKRLMMVATLASLFVGLLAAPALAKGKSAEAPAQVCKANDNTWDLGDTDHPFFFTIHSDGGCASSVAQGFDPLNGNMTLSKSAFNSQCKFLEGLGVVEYPYAFYGNPDYLAENRADCHHFLYSFHNGLLPPGPG